MIKNFFGFCVEGIKRVGSLPLLGGDGAAFHEMKQPVRHTGKWYPIALYGLGSEWAGRTHLTQIYQENRIRLFALIICTIYETFSSLDLLVLPTAILDFIISNLLIVNYQ